MADKPTFADRLINPIHKQNKRDYYHAKMLVNISSITGLFAIGYLLLSYIFDFSQGVYFLSFSILGFAFVTLLTKTRLNIIFLANLYVSVGAVAIFYLAVFSGGLYSPVMLWLIPAPILALLVANRWSAITWCLVVMLAILLLSYLEIFEQLPEGEIPEKWKLLITLLIILGLMLVIFIFSLKFDSSKNDALKSAARKNKELIRLLHQLTRTKNKLTTSNNEINSKNNQLLAQQTEIVNQTIQLKELNEEKDYIIEVLAHDLKEPLNSVDGLLDLILRDDNKLSRNQKECVDHIQKSVNKSRTLLTKILFSGEMDNRKIKVSWEKVNLCEILHNSTESFRNQAIKKDIEIKTICSKKEIYTLTDGVLVNQIFQNLLSNGIKFSPAKSVVTLTIELLEKNIKVEFSDQGPGIAEHELEKLFDKYTRLSSKPTSGESSSGLGLSLVKKYVELIEAKIWYENNKDNGATFVLLLPLKYV